MKKIKLYNRDGADLWLEKTNNLSSGIPNTSEWVLKVDKKHKYCLEYMRIIGDYPKTIEAIDPSGGPMISMGDKIDKFEVVNIINSTTLWLSERNNDN